MVITATPLRKNWLIPSLLRALCLTCVSTVGQLITFAAEETWVGPVSSNWSVGSNWLDGTAPAPPGASDLTLRFVTAGVYSTNDLGLFSLNRLIADWNSTSSLTIFSTAYPGLIFTGTAPEIVNSGFGSLVLN